jgi:hypothetical protein
MNFCSDLIRRNLSVARSRRRNERWLFSTLWLAQCSTSCFSALPNSFIGAVRAEAVRGDRLGRGMAPERLLHEPERRILVAGFGDVAFKYLALVTHGSPEVHHLAFELHVHLIEMPSPVTEAPIRLTRCRRMSPGNIGPNIFH